EAVACRMRSHTAIGVTVSGGLDSSSVFGMACRLAGDQPGVRAYALTSTIPAADERRYLDDVLARWPVPAHTVSCDDWDGPTTLEQCAMRRDVPDLPNGAPWSILYQAAQRDGVRVMLGGDGGDEWLSGSLWHQADLLRTLRLFSLWKDCRATGWSFDHAILPLIPRPLKRLARRCVPEPLPPWIDPGFAARVGLRDRWQRRPTIRPSTCAQRDLLSALDSGWYALQHELTNRLEAERGIEGRSPFYDRRLIECALALPGEQRRRGTVLKLVLRRAMGDLVPKSIRLRRTKAEFSHLYRHAIEREGPEARLSSLRLADVGCLSMPAVRQLYADYRRGTADPHALWMIFAIDAWYRTLFT